MIKVKKLIIKKESDLLVLKSLWEKLQSGPDMTYFQSYEWNRLLFQQWNNDMYNTLFSTVVIYYTEGIIAPLLIQHRGVSYKWLGRKKGIYFLGTGSSSDYMNCVFSSFNSFDMEQMLHQIHEDYPKYNLYLNFIRAENKMCRLLENHYSFVSEVAVSIITHDKPELYTKGLSKSTRQNLRTALNRMERDGCIYKYEIHKGILNNELIEELLSIHRFRVISKNKYDGSIKKKVSSKIRQIQIDHLEKNNNIIRYAMKTVKSSITVMVFLNEKIVGYLYGFLDKESIRIVHNCYNENYKFYSPMFRGTYDFLLECCKDPGVKEVDFTRGDEEYKYKLGGTDSEIRSFILPK